MKKRREEGPAAVIPFRNESGAAGHGPVPTVPKRPSEDMLALAFANQHAQRLRHIALWPAWIEWNGTYWSKDTTIHVYDLARRMLRDGSLK